MKSLLVAMQDYIELMLDRVPGMKVLVTDSETTGMLSMIYSQSQILEREVFLVERIESEAKEQMRHLNAVCLLRPTDKNFMLLSKELKSPKYNSYHLFFTNVVPHHRLEQLACCDELEVVQQVQEVFCDVYAVTHEVFSLNQNCNIGMCMRSPLNWSAYEESIFARHLEGCLSVLLALQSVDGNRPSIRFSRQSSICGKLANDLSARIMEEHGLFGRPDVNDDPGNCSRVVLVVDRRDDPVTPLLNQWTYQAMVAELLGLENNRVDLRKAPGVKAEQKEIVMSILHDPFFEQNLFANFGDLGVAIKQYVETYQQQTKNNAKIDTIEEMQKFVDSYPEFRKLSGNVSKHVTVVHELSRLISAGGLLDVSQLEQDLACSESKTEHLNSCLEKIRSDKINNMERLRLCLLFALRYEADQQSINMLKDELRNCRIDADQVQLVDCLLSYAGAHVRQGDLFQNKSMWTAGMAKLNKGFFKGIENVYTRHVSQLKSTVDNLIRGKLKEADFPFPANSLTGSAKDRLTDVIVFCIGGATFEEARDMNDLRKEHKGVRIVLGGSCMHNSKSLLADIAQLSRAL